MTDDLADLAEQRRILAASAMERRLFRGSLDAPRCIDCGEPIARHAKRCVQCAPLAVLTDEAVRMSRFHRG